MTSVRHLIAAAVVLACATTVAAQGGQDLSQVQIKPTKISDRFYTLEGQGGMIGILTGHILKDPDLLLRYHQELDPPPPGANRPIEIEPTLEALEAVLRADS